MSIGLIGLVQAADTYKPEHDAKFSTYAAHCVINEILSHLEHIGRKSRTATIVSLNTPIDTDIGPGTLADVLPDEFSLEQHVEKLKTGEIVRKAVETLPPQQRKVIELRYGINGNAPHLHREIAEQLGISKQCVNYYEQLGIKNLRKKLEGKI